VDAIETALRGGTPKGMVDKKQAREVFRLDTQVGVRTSTNKADPSRSLP
jgi:hypothetical protein